MGVSHSREPDNVFLLGLKFRCTIEASIELKLNLSFTDATCWRCSMPRNVIMIGNCSHQSLIAISLGKHSRKHSAFLSSCIRIAIVTITFSLIPRAVVHSSNIIKSAKFQGFSVARTDLANFSTHVQSFSIQLMQ